MTATFYVGDAIEVMSKLPEKSVDLVLTSPPFLALRSYLPADHPDKALEGGSQATPGEFIDWLIDVVEACDRVLAPHGSLCIELGDTYAGAQPNQLGEFTDEWAAKYAKRSKVRAEGLIGEHRRTGDNWPLAKSLSLIPELFRLTLVYGNNPLTGRTTERWRLRNVVRWVRPNPPVGALGDKFRPATSELMVFCKSAKRYFDLDSVRSEWKPRDDMGTPRAYHSAVDGGYDKSERVLADTNGGAPPLDWWNIPLLEGEEETRYGPKMKPSANRPRDRYPDGLYPSERDGSFKFQNTGSRGDDGKPFGQMHPLGPPPLDWWRISSDAETVAWCETHRAEKSLDLDGQGMCWKREAGYHRFCRFVDALLAPLTPSVGAPPLDWWEIPPGGYQGSHYAVFPPELCIKPIKAMCPEKVCRVCGEPSRRIVEVSYARESDGGPVPEGGWRSSEHHQTEAGWKGSQGRAVGPTFVRAVKNTETLGFSDCGHDDWRPGLVLDPFGGSGTTALVATGHGRDCILIDLDERNFDLALERVGPFILSRAESV